MTMTTTTTIAFSPPSEISPPHHPHLANERRSLLRWCDSTPDLQVCDDAHEVIAEDESYSDGGTGEDDDDDVGGTTTTEDDDVVIEDKNDDDDESADLVDVGDDDELGGSFEVLEDDEDDDHDDHDNHDDHDMVGDDFTEVGGDESTIFTSGWTVASHAVVSAEGGGGIWGGGGPTFKDVGESPRVT